MRSFATITLSSHHYQILSSLKSNKTNLIVFIIAMGNPNKGLPKSWIWTKYCQICSLTQLKKNLIKQPLLRGEKLYQWIFRRTYAPHNVLGIPNSFEKICRFHIGIQLNVSHLLQVHYNIISRILKMLSMQEKSTTNPAWQGGGDVQLQNTQNLNRVPSQGCTNKE